jgi:hypothetical protein
MAKVGLTDNAMYILVNRLAVKMNVNAKMKMNVKMNMNKNVNVNITNGVAFTIFGCCQWEQVTVAGLR